MPGEAVSANSLSGKDHYAKSKTKPVGKPEGDKAVSNRGAAPVALWGQWLGRTRRAQTAGGHWG